MPATVTSMNQAQLASALSELEVALREGEAELKQKPDQYQMVKTLYTELKKMKPGQTPSAKVTTLLQSFLKKQLDEEIRDQNKLLASSRTSGSGPVIKAVSEAHKATLNALSVARDGVAALTPSLSNDVAAGTGIRMNNANQSAERALQNAEAAKVFAPVPAKK